MNTCIVSVRWAATLTYSAESTFQSLPWGPQLLSPSQILYVGLVISSKIFPYGVLSIVSWPLLRTYLLTEMPPDHSASRVDRSMPCGVSNSCLLSESSFSNASISRLGTSKTLTAPERKSLNHVRKLERRRSACRSRPRIRSDHDSSMKAEPSPAFLHRSLYSG